MHKININIRDLIVIIASISALIISLFAFREARLSNILNIEPIISIYYQKELEENELEFIIRNEGNIDVKNIKTIWAVAFIKSEAKKPVFFIQGIGALSDFLGVNKTISHRPIYLKNEIKLINEMPKEDIPFFRENHNYDTPDKSVIKDKGRGGLFLILKTEYRRISDSKLFKKTSYFSIVPMSLKIDVTDIEKMSTPDNRKYLKLLEEALFF